MSEAKWTNEQLEAITEKGRNILVAAAAGAGKTAVLVERIIRKITDKKNSVDIDRLLVVTFTNAAAAEMRERIGDAIAKEIEKHPDSRRLQKQLTLLNRASITTIHSFCLEVIRNNFHFLDLDPDFRIADETEALLMKMEALEELFEQKYEKDLISEDFLELVECFGGSKDDQPLQEMVMRLYSFVQSHPWPRKWLDESSEAFNLEEGTDFSATAWGEVVLKGVNIELIGLLGMMEEAVEIMEGANGFEPYLKVFNDEVSDLFFLIKKIESGATWDQLYNAFRSLEFQRLARCGKEADRGIQEKVKAVRETVKKSLKKIKDEIFAYDSSSIAEDLRKLYPLMEALSELVAEFTDRYSAKKREKALLDFNDLEHFCLNILVEQDEGVLKPSATALELRERFLEILIDEYQDSNLVQEIILSSISRKDSENPNIFMVGDVKQSIYRFRQSRPELFMDKYNRYSDKSGFENRKILLYKNFRSRKEVIDGVNFLFAQIMSLNVGELDYDENEALKPGLIYTEPAEGIVCSGEVELNIIDVSYSNEIDDMADAGSFEENEDDLEAGNDVEGLLENEEELTDIQAEARIVVKRIKELITGDEEGKPFQVYDKKTKKFRSLKFRDIVILMRATRNWADVFEEELAISGIPCYADTGTGYFKTIEVQTALSLLQIVDNPMQDIPLLSVLRSPIASFDTEELVDIRAADIEGTFYEAMQKYAAEGDTKTSRKAADFLENLEKWRDRSLYMSTDELIWHLYTDTGYYSYTGAMPGGIQRQANLRMLFERARQYEGTSYRGLFNFINFINRLKSSQGDMGSAKIIGENEDVVRIMSIHKSKGLEFPVVIVAGCGKKFNMMDLNSKILLHHDLGFGPDYVDYKRRITYPTAPKHALRYKMRLEALSEEMRILYVALTRAREKLIITGSVKGIVKTAAAWYGCSSAKGAKLQEYHMLKAKNYLDWIGPAAIRHSDCEILREEAGLGNEQVVCRNDSSRWQVRLYNKKDAFTGMEGAKKESEELAKWLKEIQTSGEQSLYGEEIKKRLEWSYDYKVLNRLPTKLSVTELKRYFNTEASEEYAPQGIFATQLVKKPLFLEEDRGLNSAEKGTALHFVMQHLDLGKLYKKVSLTQSLDEGRSSELYLEVSSQVKQMASDELLTQQQAEVVDIKRIVRFFLSPLGERLLKSQRVYREAPFNMELSLTDLYKNIPGDIFDLKESMSDSSLNSLLEEETLLIQGVIDCYFEEDDEIVLVDYKTDYVPPEGSGIIRERYRIQLQYYADVLSKMTDKKIKEKCIYLFWNGEVIEYS